MEDWDDGVMQDWNMGVLRLKDWALQLASNLPTFQPSRNNNEVYISRSFRLLS